MKLAFEEHGSGKPIVLLHAFPLSRQMWRPQIETLVAANCRVILPDFRGFGKSPLESDAVSIEQMARDVNDLLDDLKIKRASLAGLSMGGYVAFNLYRIFPEKFAALVLADTNSAADTEEKRRARFSLIEKVESIGAQVLIDEMLPNLISDYTKEKKPELVKEIEKMFLEIKPKGAINALRAMAERRDHTKLLVEINVPTLLIFGKDDKITNMEAAENLPSKIENSKLFIIENAGHFSNLEQFDKFNTALKEFVESVEL